MSAPRYSAEQDLQTKQSEINRVAGGQQRKQSAVDRRAAVIRAHAEAIRGGANPALLPDPSLIKSMSDADLVATMKRIHGTQQAQAQQLGLPTGNAPAPVGPTPNGARNDLNSRLGTVPTPAAAPAATAPSPMDTLPNRGRQTVANTYNGRPVSGANTGGGMTTNTRILDPGQQTAFDYKGRRTVNNVPEYNPNQDKTARSVVNGTVVPYQPGAPVQIDKKYGGGVGTVSYGPATAAHMIGDETGNRTAEFTQPASARVAAKPAAAPTGSRMGQLPSRAAVMAANPPVAPTPVSGAEPAPQQAPVTAAAPVAPAAPAYDPNPLNPVMKGLGRAIGSALTPGYMKPGGGVIPAPVTAPVTAPEPAKLAPVPFDVFANSGMPKRGPAPAPVAAPMPVAAPVTAPAAPAQAVPEKKPFKFPIILAQNDPMRLPNGF